MSKSKIQTPNDSEVVTRKILREELRGFATKDDLKSELAKYATKDDLQQAIDSHDEKFATKDDMNEMADFVIERLSKYIDDKNSEMMIHIDHISKGIDDLRTENEVGTHQIRTLRVRVDGHEKRLKALESAS